MFFFEGLKALFPSAKQVFAAESPDRAGSFMGLGLRVSLELSGSGLWSKHRLPVHRPETPKPHLGVSENRGPEYSTVNSRILIIRTPKYGTPNFRKLLLKLQTFNSRTDLQGPKSRVAKTNSDEKDAAPKEWRGNTLGQEAWGLG